MVIAISIEQGSGELGDEQNGPRGDLWKEAQTEVTVLEVMTTAQVESTGQFDELDHDLIQLFDEIHSSSMNVNKIQSSQAHFVHLFCISSLSFC